jgi:hypothetical protein
MFSHSENSIFYGRKQFFLREKTLFPVRKTIN